MHPKVLASETWKLIAEMAASGVLEGWTLGGGTGLALQFGHRTSEDLDFFRTGEFQPDQMAEVLKQFGKVQVQHMAQGTLHALVRGTRLSFLKLEAPLNHPGTPYRGFTVADPSDIATLKLVAIAGRGSRKDFIDLYVYFQNAPGLGHLLTLLEQRDPMIDWNRYHILKSLSYFEDAENEPMPKMLQKIEWESVMFYFRDIARRAF